MLFANTANHTPYKEAVFAGGCFWCMQPPFDKLEGVIETTVGYSGEDVENPTYKEVSSGQTGHAESILVLYDPTKVSYTDLLTVFWQNIDPTAKEQQFCDKGNQYRSAIFYHNEEQKKSAEQSKSDLQRANKFENIYTEIVPLTHFYKAEAYHQEYYKKNPYRYKLYRFLCGRDKQLQKLWGDSK